jgi:pyrroline-5-carboxylate reductase
MNNEYLFKNVNIGFIGAGNMATSILNGISTSKLCDLSAIYMSHPHINENCKKQLINETTNNDFVAEKCDLLLLCVKPQILESVVEKLGNYLDVKRHFIISICAGVSLKKLENLFNKFSTNPEQKFRIARCTLNTAAKISESCSVYSHTNNLNEADLNRLNKILSSIGTCFGQLDDSLMDAATSVLGSGIAYMYMMCDAMADGGVKMGLSKQLALKMSIHTMLGAAKLMVDEPETHPAKLKDNVCSPGGTTIHGVHELEKNGFKNAIMCAVEAAVKRAQYFNS